MAGPPGPLRSPDGLSWWDGSAWQPISTLGAPPPAPPAQTPPVPFPEGSPEPQRWPDWLPRTRAAEALVDDAVTQSETPPPPRATPAAPAPAAAHQGGTLTSTWKPRLAAVAGWLDEHRRLAVGAGLAIIGLVLLYAVVQVFIESGLFGSGGGSTTTDRGPTGSQFQQADGFVSGSLNPALSSLAAATGPIAIDCGGTYSVTCRNTLENADAATVKTIAVIDRGPFPVCVAAPLVQTRQDLVTMEQGIRTALIGFRENSQALITRGLAQLNLAAPALKVDGDALKVVEQSPACPR